jgi:Pyridoxamine 5'-phosphate oxidase
MTGDRSALAATGRETMDSNSYMTLGTADAEGRPWVSPVWFAAVGYTELLWVSSPDTRHSRNLAARPELSIVVFDSTLPPYTGQALYMEALGAEVGKAELGDAIEAFSTASLAGGAGKWSAEDVRPPAGLRLYLARVSRHWVLGETDERIEVNLAQADSA